MKYKFISIKRKIMDNIEKKIRTIKEFRLTDEQKLIKKLIDSLNKFTDKEEPHKIYWFRKSELVFIEDSLTKTLTVNSKNKSWYFFMTKIDKTLPLKENFNFICNDIMKNFGSKYMTTI